MTDNTKMREAFEKWYITNTFAHVDHLSVFYNDLNCYPTPIANHCWKAWQAARTVPEGYVMVPVEPTSDMVCAAIDAGTIDDDDVLWVWGEMLSAAPEGEK